MADRQSPNAVRCPRTRPPGTSPTCGRRERRVHYDGVAKACPPEEDCRDMWHRHSRAGWPVAGGITGWPASWLCQARATCESLKRQQAQPTLVDLVRVDVGAGCGTGFQAMYFTGSPVKNRCHTGTGATVGSSSFIFLHRITRTCYGCYSCWTTEYPQCNITGLIGPCR